MRQYSVVVARFPGNHAECPESTDWVIDTIRKMDKDPRISKVGRFTKSDTPITMVRNQAVQTCLAQNADYLLMIDNDMGPDIPGPFAKPFWDSSWEFMMDRREQEDECVKFNPFLPATVAAPYCGPAPAECVYVFHWTSMESGLDHNDALSNFRLEMIPRETAAIRTGFEEAAALATGLILYDMRVFQQLEPPWFDYEWEDKFQTKKVTTEDVYQTRNASLIGLPQYVNWDAWSHHIKRKKVGRPEIYGVDHVHHTLVNAVHRDIRSDERFRVVRGITPKHVPSDMREERNGQVILHDGEEVPVQFDSVATDSKADRIRKALAPRKEPGASEKPGIVP